MSDEAWFSLRIVALVAIIAGVIVLWTVDFSEMSPRSMSPRQRAYKDCLDQCHRAKGLQQENTCPKQCGDSIQAAGFKER